MREEKVAMNNRLLAFTVAAATIVSTAPARGSFSTVVNAPPDEITPDLVFRLDTQINLYPATLFDPVDVINLGGPLAPGGYEWAPPAEHVQLNVLGGGAMIVNAWFGSEFNVVDGFVNTANLLGGRGTMARGLVQTWGVFGNSRLDMSGGLVGRVETSGLDTAPDPDASRFVMTGGDVVRLDATGDVEIHGGSVNHMIFRGGGSVELTGGFIGDDFEVGSVVTGAIPGEPTRETVVGRGGRVIVRGGSVGRRMILHEARTLDFSGGVISEAFQADEGSRVNIRGSQFFLGTSELTVPAGGSLVVEQRDVVLSGVLADGAPFRFHLNSQPRDGDYFPQGTTITVVSVPEPQRACFALLLMLVRATRRSSQGRQIAPLRN